MASFVSVSLTLTVGLFTEASPAMIPADDDQLWSYRIAEVEERLSGIGWTEPRLPWGVHPLRWHLSEEECSTTFCSDLFSCPSDLCEEAEVVYTALAYGSGAARLSRSMDDYDSEPYGYAVPVGFRGFPFNVGPFGDAFVVSAFQVVEECERLGEVGGSVDVDAARFCSVLLDVARHSLRTGCAVVFAG